MRCFILILLGIIGLQSCHSNDFEETFDDIHDKIEEKAKRPSYHDNWELIVNENVLAIQQLIKNQINGNYVLAIDSTDARVVTLRFMNQELPLTFFRHPDDEDFQVPCISIAPEGNNYYWMLDGQFLTNGDSHKIKVLDEHVTPLFQHVKNHWQCQIGTYVFEIDDTRLSSKSLSLSEDIDNFVVVSFPSSCQLILPKSTFEMPHIPQKSFYKDLFIDAGIGLNSRKSLYAADYLGLSTEAIAFSRDNYTIEEQTLQNSILAGDEKDTNGRLLYPDGQPRYKLLFVCGGSATTHGASMSGVALRNIRDFVHHGGSYVGTCAGAFFASKGYDGNFDYPYYLSIMPSMMQRTRLSNVKTGMYLEKDSPLLKYYDFGGDHYISDVRHNKGGYPVDMPKEVEVLARYDYPEKSDVHLQPCVWAYTPNSKSGRIVVEGSHPEEASSGESRDLTASLMQYAMDGVGETTLKGFLQNGLVRSMYAGSEDNQPFYAKIGDLQSHHFAVMIPEGARDLTLDLDSDADCDLVLMMNHDTMADRENATYISSNHGAHQQLHYESLESGVWYVSVRCLTTVEVHETDYGQSYIDQSDVLNGFPYQIMMKWNTNN